ncbi:MAG: sugar ABC transporter substrate-binding protein [Thermomicrobiales bacterium]
MSTQRYRELFNKELNRRKFLAYGAAAGAGAAFLPSALTLAQDGTIDTTEWTPETIVAQAGTLEVDTAAEVAKVVPLDYAGEVSYWYVGPADAEPQITKDIDKEFWEAFAATYPNIKVNITSLTYNDMLDQIRTAALGNAAPMVAKMPILWGVEFAAKGQLQEFGPADAGYPVEEYWPGAMKSVTYDGKTYGVPTNNETMALIWNAAIFEEAGLDPDAPPATWDDLVAYSKQIKDNTGKDGYGLVARVNAGNTPFRFMPAMWAYGGGALDEAAENPTYEEIWVNNDGSKAALQAYYQMYVTDKSVPTSALTNTQTENQAPFIAGTLGMMIAHPSEYAKMNDLAATATGADKEIADQVVENMRYGFLPEGPDRRAVVFGGSNVHVFDPSVVDGGNVDLDAARALIAFMTGPEWSTKLAWVGSNPSNIRGFQTIWMKERLDSIPNLDVTTSMLPYGIPFPVVPESTEIMNIIVPEMLQNALTESMSVEDAANDAAAKIEELRGDGL